MAKPWSAAQERDLRRLWPLVELTIEQIAEILGGELMPADVRYRARRLGLGTRRSLPGWRKGNGKSESKPSGRAESDRDRPRQRVCLRCGERFLSAWCGNRLCQSCSGTVAGQGGALPEAGLAGVKLR